DRQAETRAFALRTAAPEAVERPSSLRGGQAGALVEDGDLDPGRRFAGAERDASAGRRGLDRVLDQVVERVPETFRTGAGELRLVHVDLEDDSLLPRQRRPRVGPLSKEQ